MSLFLRNELSEKNWKFPILFILRKNGVKYYNYLFIFYVWQNRQLVGHVLELHMVVLSNCYHYNLQVFPRCPLRGTQNKSGGFELETSWNFIRFHFHGTCQLSCPPGGMFNSTLVYIMLVK